MTNLLKRLKRLLSRRPSPAGAAFDDPFLVQKHLLVGVVEPTIFDVGANVGLITRRYRDLFPFARIHAFEPFPEAFDELKRSTRGDDRTNLRNCAVSDSNGSAILNCNTSHATNSLLATDEKAFGSWGPQLLETNERLGTKTVRLDSYCEESGIETLDILKLDIQGGEYAAIKGAARLFSQHAISLIYFELLVVPTYEHQATISDYLQLMESFDYSLLGIYNMLVKNRQLMQFDAIFVCPSLSETVRNSADAKQIR